MADITYGDAACIGLAQAVAIVPGISRSGSTLGMGLIRGLKKETAIKFAFMMSVPIIAASAILGIKNIIEDPGSFDWTLILAGMVSAGVSGYFAVRFMLNFFRRRSMRVFSIYVAVLGIFILLDQLIFQRFFDTFLVFSMT